MITPAARSAPGAEGCRHPSAQVIPCSPPIADVEFLYLAAAPDIAALGGIEHFGGKAEHGSCDRPALFLSRISEVTPKGKAMMDAADRVRERLLGAMFATWYAHDVEEIGRAHV